MVILLIFRQAELTTSVYETLQLYIGIQDLNIANSEHNKITRSSWLALPQGKSDNQIWHKAEEVLKKLLSVCRGFEPANNSKEKATAHKEYC